LRAKAVDGGALLFLTTHSSVFIDVFENDAEAQIVHVTHENGRASVRTAAARSHHHGVLDDLDARASDVLQSNCVVWVEGPSDRRYFNRWIELWTNGNLREGAHYQCVFYGGKLLAHLSAAAESDDSADSLVDLLRMNRHAIVLVDSDRSKASNGINSTKKRIVDEMGQGPGIAWVTAGREIENYLPPATLAKLRDEKGDVTKPRKSSPFSKFSKTVATLGGEANALYSKSKVAFADNVVALLERDDIAGHLDLAQRLDAVVAKIKQWNSITDGR
jgi:putative ATP-dependent endonuclease of OLD family